MLQCLTSRSASSPREMIIRALVLNAAQDLALAADKTAALKEHQTSLTQSKSEGKQQTLPSSPAMASKSKPLSSHAADAHDTKDLDWNEATDRWQKFLMREIRLDHEQRLVDTERAKIVQRYLHTSSVKGRVQSLYLPSDYSPSFGMVQNYWKTFTSRPPSHFPGMGMAQTGEDLDRRIKQLRSQAGQSCADDEDCATLKSISLSKPQATTRSEISKSSSSKQREEGKHLQKFLTNYISDKKTVKTLAKTLNSELETFKGLQKNQNKHAKLTQHTSKASEAPVDTRATAKAPAPSGAARVKKQVETSNIGSSHGNKLSEKPNKISLDKKKRLVKIANYVQRWDAYKFCLRGDSLSHPSSIVNDQKGMCDTLKLLIASSLPRRSSLKVGGDLQSLAGRSSGGLASLKQLNARQKLINHLRFKLYLKEFGVPREPQVEDCDKIQSTNPPLSCLDGKANGQSLHAGKKPAGRDWKAVAKLWDQMSKPETVWVKVNRMA
eukprot:236773-Hanusia_phi.AAC.2